MNASKYEVFLRVVELGSVTHAAEEMGYTQSGVSHIISGLENELQLALLHRSRTGVRLTDAGERLLPHLRSVVRENEALMQKAAAIRGLCEGAVRLGAFSSVSVSWLPPILKAFAEAEPGISITMYNGDYHDIENWLEEKAVDMAFTILPAEGELEVIPLKKDPLYVIVPNDHPMAGAEQFPLKELENESFIGLMEDSSHDTLSLLKGKDIRLKKRYATKDDYALLSMVEHGLGVSIVPGLLLRGMEGRLSAVLPEGGGERTIALAMQKNSSPAARRLSEFIADWVKNNA